MDGRLEYGKYHPPNVGKYRNIKTVGETNAFMDCDLISQQFVGDQYFRCLRTFIHPSTYCNNIFDVYYMPVEKRRFEDIRIEILTLTGVPVSFTDSKKPTKTVYFRRVSTYYTIYKYRRLPRTFIMKDPFVQYCLRQLVRGSTNGIGPIYSVPPFIQRGHSISSFLSFFFEWFDPSFGAA